METIVRQPAVEGMFYPSDERELQNLIKSYLNEAVPADYVPKALIVPHAGYVYSGSIAASGYRLIRKIANRIHRVVLLGPAHRMAFSGMALPTASRFRTPLGEVSVDEKALKKIESLPGIQYLDQPHGQEHSLEVHLPFLQTLLEAFMLVPILVGDTEAEQVGNVIDALWQESDTLVVISTDLSHYHDYATARCMDECTSKAIEEMRYNDIGYEDACGRNPVNGLLWLAGKKHLHVHRLDVRNSGDTAGSRDHVVGYGAYCIA